ncbi:hypothetical protein DV736_g4804, partial [Chaetothyriales sp. CBS 134916]
MNVFIAGTTIAGGGAGISELTALAVTSESAPTRKRGAYVAVLVFIVIPFVPCSLYARLIALLHLAILRAHYLYLELPRPDRHQPLLLPTPYIKLHGKTKKQVLAEIDYVVGFLSISGLVLFLAGLQWGGYQIILIIVYIVWEGWCAKYSMFPHRLKQNPRILGLTLLITSISDANFFFFLMFWPTQAYNVYRHDPIQVGLRILPGALGILTGDCVVLALLSYFRGRNKELMVISCVLMTASTGSLACATQYNMHKLWGLPILGALGIGGIVVPASIISTIICPDDLIATVSALAVSIRVVSGCVSCCAYYNVLAGKFVPNAIKYIGVPMVTGGSTTRLSSSKPSS